MLALSGASMSFAQDTDIRPFQVSFVPNLGTNTNPENRYVNNISLNVLAGINEGVKGAELGSIANFDTKGVTGVQVGGVVNLVGGDVTGAQLGGVFNGVKGHVKGLQTGGTTNMSNSFTGVQLAGVNNFSATTSDGLQAGGVTNFTGEDHNGTQIAGVSNYANTVTGSQISGVFNHTKVLKGFQLSGVVNQAGTVNGLQFGLINLADTVEKGATFGLINIVRTGLHQFEVSSNDVTDFNISFRSGTHAFYSILTAGVEGKKDGFWSYGAGFGSRVLTVKKFSGNIEATTNTVQSTKKVTDKLSMDNRLNLIVNYSYRKHLNFNGGPVVHFYLSEPFSKGGSTYGLPIVDNPIWNKNYSNSNMKVWIGYQVGVRF